eukprot:TRINITY_DN7461_c0_g1_i2.p1 TRINITY_DN7461_c0_g1~~TRINITY_DN7461_c0_g1_i2.p1  ORF type:complete len:202 (-),score=54.76 TRINITY_DN7461_c0_g1_i2:137-742(-)
MPSLVGSEMCIRDRCKNMEALQLTVNNPENPRKIPQAVFLEGIEDLVKKYTAEKILENLQEIYNKYKLMELQIQKSKENMKVKIPEIQKALEIVSHIKQNSDKETTLDFLLTETIWSKAKVRKDTKKVALWLGANVMVEYTFDEAILLLEKNLQNALGNLKSYEEDINYLKDQVTTCEVNISRVYNVHVQMVQLESLKPKK